MSHKRKTDYLKIISATAFSSAAVAFAALCKYGSQNNIPFVLSVVTLLIFIVEASVLLLLRSRNTAIKILRLFVVFIINVSLFSGAVIYSFAPALIIKPHSDEKAYEELMQTEGVEEISFEGKNGRINGFIYNKNLTAEATLVYFYGNYETAAGAMLNIIRNNVFDKSGKMNIAVFDYPSYGKSEGKCTDKTLLGFSEDVYDVISGRTEKILVCGYSLGTGVAAYLSSVREVSGLVLIAPYADGYDLYNNVLDIFHGPVKGLVAFNIEAVSYAPEIDVPSLIVASHADRTIPFESSQRLYSSFSEAELVEFVTLGHNDFISDSEVNEIISEYLSEACGL